MTDALICPICGAFTKEREGAFGQTVVEHFCMVDKIKWPRAAPATPPMPDVGAHPLDEVIDRLENGIGVGHTETFVLGCKHSIEIARRVRQEHLNLLARHRDAALAQAEAMPMTDTEKRIAEIEKWMDIDVEGSPTEQDARWLISALRAALADDKASQEALSAALDQRHAAQEALKAAEAREAAARAALKELIEANDSAAVLPRHEWEPVIDAAVEKARAALGSPHE